MKIFQVGDSAFCVEFGPQIDPETNQLTLRFAASLDAKKGARDIEIVPAYSSVTVYFNPLTIHRLSLIEWLEGMGESRTGPMEVGGRLHRIPVAYGGDCGPDLLGVARLNHLSPEKVVQIHAEQEFRVFMLGFMPGFPYCGIVPEKIRAPRLSSPRTRVPAGSVGIAGAQTGIYPLESPGGWRLIGRTPENLFNPSLSSDKMFLFKPGDRIQFFSISVEEFHEREH